MNFRQATPEDVRRTEARVDAAFAGGLRALTADNKESALRYLLAVAEDKQRLPLLAFSKAGPQALVNWGVICDNMKYALKDALPAVLQLPASTSSSPDVLEEQPHRSAAGLLDWCERYQPARVAFGSYYAGATDCRIDQSDRILKFRYHPLLERYGALDALLGAVQDEVPSQPIQLWFLRPDLQPPLCSAIANCATPAGTARLDVRFDWDLARSLGELIPTVPGVLPRQWSAQGWGTGADLHAVFQALQTVATYHLIAVLFGAGVHHTEQAAAASAVLEISARVLVSRVVALSGVEQRLASRVLEALVFGRGAESPDPALQPLIPLGIGDTLLLSPMLVLTSNMPRNFLSLLQRIDANSFHTASRIFEDEMIARLEPPLRAKGWALRSRFAPSWLRATAGEIDLLVADRGARILCVIELRWMLPSGDTRDVHRKYEELLRKAQQARTKASAVTGRLDPVLQEVVGPSEDSGRWRVMPVVVTAGFSGPADTVPSVREERWSKTVQRSAGLKALLANLEPDRWLPRKGRDYERHARTFRYGDVSIEWPGVTPTESGITRAMEMRRLD